MGPSHFGTPTRSQQCDVAAVPYSLFNGVARGYALNNYGEARVGVTGTIEGAGTIEFSTGATALGAGSSITKAGLMIAGTGARVTVAGILSYAGSFSAGTNTELTIASGDLLKLTGPVAFSKDTIDGAGRLITTGPTTAAQVTLGGTAQ
jgi:hypothetical protein